MNSEHLKIAFMRGVLKADHEAGVTLKDHMGMLKTAWPGWAALAMPALGAGIGAMASPGEELKGAMGGGLVGLGGYGALRTVGALGKGAVRGVGKLFSRGASAAAKAAPAAAATAAKVAPTVAGAAPAATKALSPAWKAGLIGAGVGTGLGVGGYHALSGPKVSPEEQQMLEQYRAQQMQQMNQMGLTGQI
jgi:hypothetical protein